MAIFDLVFLFDVIDVVYVFLILSETLLPFNQTSIHCNSSVMRWTASYRFLQFKIRFYRQHKEVEKYANKH